MKAKTEQKKIFTRHFSNKLTDYFYFFIRQKTTLFFKNKRHLLRHISLLFFYLGVLFVSPSHAEVLSPINLKNIKGRASSQPLKVLSIQDQANDDDNWDSYIDFNIGRRGYKGLFTFKAPTNISHLDNMELHANFRGEEKPWQRWIFKIFDYQERKWVYITDNSGAQARKWKSIIKSVGENPKRFISRRNKIKVRFYTKGSVADSQLDYLAIKTTDLKGDINTSDADQSTNPGVENVTTVENNVTAPTPSVENKLTDSRAVVEDVATVENNVTTPIPSVENKPTAPRPIVEDVAPAEDAVIIEETSSVPTTTNWWKPKPGSSWEIIYTGSRNNLVDVDIYNIDLFSINKSEVDAWHAQGKRVICYFSGGSVEDWNTDAKDFPVSVIGNNLDNWAGEKWLDIRNLDALLPIMKKRMDLAVIKGCDAVDPDNMDGHTQNSGFPLTANDQLVYNIAIAEYAHSSGLAVGMKNNVEQTNDLVQYFDFAVTEECNVYNNECGYLTPFINQGKPVYGIEYTIPRSQFCPKMNEMGFDFLKKRRNLDSFRESCR